MRDDHDNAEAEALVEEAKEQYFSTQLNPKYTLREFNKPLEDRISAIENALKVSEKMTQEVLAKIYDRITALEDSKQSVASRFMEIYNWMETSLNNKLESKESLRDAIDKYLD
jgi:predicted phage tail protein